MKNFDWTQFTRKIAIKASKKELYQAWTQSHALSRWFLSDAVFLDTNVPIAKDDEARRGHRYKWYWYGYDGVGEGEVIEANGTDSFQFTFGGDCLVAVSLKEVKDLIMVEITQSNIPTDEKSKRELRLGCDQGWTFYLFNLKSVFEADFDLRNKDPELKGMINS